MAILLAALPFLSSCGGGSGAAGGGAGSGAAVKSDPASSLPAISPATAQEILAAVQESGQPVMLNVWATWCRPCREEFPDLMRAYRDRDMRLILVSADFPDQVEEARSFLAEQGVDFASFLKEGADMEFIDSLSPGWSGALPATFVFDAGGNLLDFWEGGAAYETMVGRFDAAIASIEGSNGQGGYRR